MARNRLLRGASLVCALAALASASAAAQEFPDFSGLGGGVAPLGAEAPLVTVEAEFTPAKDDQPAMVFVTAKVADGYHVYAVDQGKKNGGGPQATSIKLAPNQPVTLKGEFRPIQAPKTHIDETAWRGLELREHEGTVTWYAPIEIGPAADLGSLKIKGVFDGQACNENTCVPQRVEFTAQRGPGVPIPAQPIEPIRGAAAETPLASLVGYGILGGLILNLMPCVLPVIGLKVLSFAKQGGESPAHVMALNLAYVAGLMLVFMVLATLAAAVQLGPVRRRASIGASSIRSSNSK
jgi:thiol:disulfide interchange protein DsbD